MAASTVTASTVVNEPRGSDAIVGALLVVALLRSVAPQGAEDGEDLADQPAERSAPRGVGDDEEDAPAGVRARVGRHGCDGKLISST